MRTGMPFQFKSFDSDATGSL